MSYPAVNGGGARARGAPSGARPRRRGRRGMTLIEVLVVLAILVALAAITIPTVSSYLQLEQRRVARDLAITYELLHEEAVLRNVTFRVRYHLDEGYYQVEVGRPETLIFDDPEKRAEYEEELADKMKFLTKEEREQAEAEDPDAFAQLQENFNTRVALPRGTRFGGVYTPQYGELVRASGDPEEPRVVESYIFPSGFTEHTVVQLVEQDDDESGYTIEIEPLSGRVHLRGEIVDFDEMDADLPDVAPELPI